MPLAARQIEPVVLDPAVQAADTVENVLSRDGLQHLEYPGVIVALCIDLEHT